VEGKDTRLPFSRPPGDHFEADGVELRLEVVIREHEVEFPARHHRVGVLHGPAHLEVERHATRGARVEQDRIPALCRQGGALLIQHPEREWLRLLGGKGAGSCTPKA
jgi:hypothetical protein